MNILGISAYYHDSAAALVADGEVVAAAQEERFSRKKHDARFPRNAVRYCLEAGGLYLSGVDYVVFYDKPFRKFGRMIETHVALAPWGFTSFCRAIPAWLRGKLFLKSVLREELRACGDGGDIERRLLFSEHHLSHAASAFYPSPFESAAVLTLDGVGEWATASLAIGDGKALQVVQELHFPHSLGLLYSAFTHYTGFRVNSGEYKMMGLAPYGEAKYSGLIFDRLLDLKADGSFRIDMSYFDYGVGLTMTSDRFHALFGGPPRRPEEPIDQRHMDLAASIQAVTEEVMLRLVRSAVQQTGRRDLCLAGGVALNCVANGRILRDGSVGRLWIQPAAGDAGGALGAALAAYHLFLDQPRRTSAHGRDAMRGGYLGPEFGQSEIESRLRAAGAVFEVLADDALLQRCTDALVEGDALGWFQGRMEFGPRALGARSILADPRSSSAQSTLNLKVKRRESFRPFAPSVLREDVAEWFEFDGDSPYMLLVANVAERRRRAITAEQRALTGIDKLGVARSEIPAVTHVDHSARVQTVRREVNPRYHALLSRFKERTGCPVLVNTSLNLRGEPIACTPEDAFRLFMATEIDTLAIGNCILFKRGQSALHAQDRAPEPDAD